MFSQLHQGIFPPKHNNQNPLIPVLVLCIHTLEYTDRLQENNSTPIKQNELLWANKKEYMYIKFFCMSSCISAVQFVPQLAAHSTLTANGQK